MDENQGNENVSEEVMESLGNPEEASQPQGDDASEGQEGELPVYAKEKIGKLKKRHQRDLRRLQDQIDSLHSRISQPQASSTTDSYMPTAEAGSDDEKIHRAVSIALRAKDDEARKAKDAEQMAYVHKQYDTLQKHLDNAADKYDDFDDVVRAPDVPFTPTIRDAVLLIENPGEVLYKLGKNKDELARIAKLHPLEQVKEINRLSFALMGGNDKPSVSPVKTVGQIKNNPVSSRSVTEKTSVSDLRARMKAGWK
jgi:hypothetical protein